MKWEPNMNSIKCNPPWEKDSSQVTIIDGFTSKIIEENGDGDGYFIEFTDSDGAIVEAGILKSEFIELPYPVKVGSYFGIIIFRLKGMIGTTVSVWPVVKFWHQSLRDEKDEKKDED